MNIIEFARDNVGDPDGIFEVQTSTGVVFAGTVYGVTDSVVTLDTVDGLIFIHMTHVVSLRAKV